MTSALEVSTAVPLSHYTRFGIGGPADRVIQTSQEEAFVQALRDVRESGEPYVVFGGGTNLIVSDEGYRGTVLRFCGDALHHEGNRVTAQSGAELQALVDYSVQRGLQGVETLAGIPGWAGAAVYGNAGAYGHSISERIHEVRFTDGSDLRRFDRAQCEFRYRESVFKRRKDWIILSVELELGRADAAELCKIADDIVRVRNAKFPPSMRCAGSIFKNFLAAELPADTLTRVPETAIREGKIPAAFFLEQSGAKGLNKGGIHVAEYHANLIYNDGHGTALQLCELISELKARVKAGFGLELEEEVQYVGFQGSGGPVTHDTH